jgi:hypothetical protein
VSESGRHLVSEIQSILAADAVVRVEAQVAAPGEKGKGKRRRYGLEDAHFSGGTYIHEVALSFAIESARALRREGATNSSHVAHGRT